MAIQAVDEQGNMQWSCIWRPYEGAPACGHANAYHISHEDTRWVSTNEIAVPACAKCGATMTVRVPTDEEMTPPIITRDEQTGKILQVVPTPGYEQFGTHWVKDADIVHTPVPHPTLAHLSTEEIQSMQEHLKAQAPDAPLDWMLTMIPHEEIHAVFPRPEMAQHQELARQLHATGKVYVEPVEQPLEAMIPLSHVKELVYGILKQHGIDPLEDTGKQQAIQTPIN